MNPITVVALCFASLLVFTLGASVVFWTSGQRRLSWPEWKAALRQGRPWHLLTATAGVAFVVSVVFMRLAALGR